MMNEQDVLNIKKEYLPGTRLQLERMDDPYTKLQPGDKGTVEFVDDAGQIHIRWDNGEGLALVPGEDDFKRLAIDDQILEAEAIKAEQIAGKHRERDRDDRRGNQFGKSERD